MSQPQARRRQVGPLEAIEIVTSPAAPWVVLFHGFGADFSDLAPLAEMIPVGRPVNWLFPNGHLTVPLGGHYQGRAWFPLRMAELEASIAAGSGVDLSKMAPPGLDKALAHGQKMIQALNVPHEKLVLGGFSQGGMLATELALRGKTAPAGLAILSGSLVDADNWEKLAPQRKGLKFFQSHGIYDSVLRVEPARKLEQLLVTAGLDGMLYEFPGQHEIPRDVLEQLGSFLRDVLPK